MTRREITLRIMRGVLMIVGAAVLAVAALGSWVLSTDIQDEIDTLEEKS